MRNYPYYVATILATSRQILQRIMKRIVYPGTFDPITRGHIDLVERASRLFDTVVLAVASSEKKKPMFDLAERMQLCRESLDHLDNIEVCSFSGLTVELAKAQNCGIILRGVRTVADYEYELQLANMNRALDPSIETVFLTPGESLSYVSSSLLREIAGMGGDVSRFVPDNVMRALNTRFAKRG
jgi:pantetheine-phosphate adenylyltransferase